MLLHEKIKSKGKKNSGLCFFSFSLRWMTWVEAACGGDVGVRSSPKLFVKDCKACSHSQKKKKKKGSSTEEKKGGLNIFKY